MKHPNWTTGAAALFVAIAAAGPAGAADICARYGAADMDKAVVQNNCWNDSVCGPDVQNPPDPIQCIKVIDQGGVGPGFAITKQKASAPDTRPVSYPSIYVGCHYGKCSQGTNLPIQLSSIKKAETSIDKLTYVGGATFDASYDIWLDPDPNNNKKNKQEIMIWLNRQGNLPSTGQPAQPIGKAVAHVTIGGLSWEVWSSDSNDVISYVAPNPVPKANLNLLDFIADVAKRSKIDGFYLMSIQAGFEPWQGGAGLEIDGFRANVER